jgi:hypothetical protein
VSQASTLLSQQKRLKYRHIGKFCFNDCPRSNFAVVALAFVRTFHFALKSDN